MNDQNIDIYKELSFLSRRTIQATLSGERNVKRVGDEVKLSPKWEIYFRNILDRRKALTSPKEQAVHAIEKLFLSIDGLLENDPEYGLKLIKIAIERCEEYDLLNHKKELERFKDKFIKKGSA